MVMGKKVAIFDWKWGRNSAPRDGQKIPCLMFLGSLYCNNIDLDPRGPVLSGLIEFASTIKSISDPVYICTWTGH